MKKTIQTYTYPPLFHLYKSINEVLRSRNVDKSFDAQDDELVFIVRRGFKKVCDFSYFDNDIFNEYNKNEITFLADKLTLTLKDLAKLIFAYSMPDTDDGDVLHNHFIHLKMLFTFMKNEKIFSLDDNHLKSFYSLLITHDLNEFNFNKRFSAANHTRISYFPEKNIRLALSRFKSQEIIPQSKYTKLKNEVCLAVTGMTYGDFKKGGTFDYLGLEVGKHYVDHCANILQDHGLYVTASRLTMENYTPPPDIILNQNLKSVVSQTLSGLEAKDIVLQHSLAMDKVKRIVKTVKIHFAKEYNHHASLFNIGNIDIINRILINLNIPERFDNQEFIRSLMFSLTEQNTKKSCDGYIEEYKSVLKSTGHPLDIKNEDLKSVIKGFLESDKISMSEVSEICTEHFGKLKILNPNSLLKGTQALSSILSIVESAGCTLFAALTGWRCSEFGFPLSSIKVSLNADPLDNAYSPYRFHVEWMVPKTSGETKLDREITLGGYLIARQLNTINLAKHDLPCLFKRNYQQNKIDDPLSDFHITTVIGKRVKRCWFKFPFEYVLFKDLKNKNSELVSTLTKSQVHSLKNVEEEVLAGIGAFTLINTKNTTHTSIGKKLESYRDGTLNKIETDIINLTISAKTKLKISKLENINRTISTAITEEILDGIKYPTPHSFRHMWAEAVLMRYRGDIGKFIRANFKHLDERFFVAYLRDKETRAVSQIAKRRVISTIVREQMDASKRGDGVYSGGFDRFITKASFLTKVLSQDEYIKKVNEIAEHRIEDIKTNAWGTCMLRKGTAFNAKCSENGVPMRFNAEPRLCLGCTNVNISEGNFTGIVVYTKGDVDACRHPDLPFFIKKGCIQTLRLAIKRITELQRKKSNDLYVKFIDHLIESIAMAEQSNQEEL
jgi:hypothetical protein